jgi:hypothetical protein
MSAGVFIVVVADTASSIGPRPIIATGANAAMGSYGNWVCVAAAVRKLDDVRSSTEPSFRRFRDEVGADDASGARLVLDDHRRVEPLAERARDRAGNDVVASSCRERHDDLDRLRHRPLRGNGRRREGEDGQASNAKGLSRVRIEFPAERRLETWNRSPYRACPSTARQPGRRKRACLGGALL